MLEIRIYGAKAQRRYLTTGMSVREESFKMEAYSMPAPRDYRHKGDAEKKGVRLVVFILLCKLSLLSDFSNYFCTNNKSF